MKYIPVEKLIAEIERRIESWTIRGKNSPLGQGKDTCESRVTELSDLLSFITSLQQEQPPLPPNLDEAAKQIAYDVCKDLYNGQEKDAIVYYAILAAIRMAKWMAEQGASMEITDKTEWADVDAFVHRNCDGATVIQIRKKEEEK